MFNKTGLYHPLITGNSGQIFFISRFTGFFIRFWVLGTIKINKKSENDQLTGHFQSVFFYIFFCFQCFFNISRKKHSKTSDVNQQSVLNLCISYHFPKNLDRTITFNSVPLKNTQTEHQKDFFLQLNK